MDRASLWRERLERQRSSGLSVSEFCRREGTSEASFYRWLKILKFPKQGRRRQSKSMFVKVHAPTNAASTGDVAIELPNGCVVRVPSDASRSAVALAVEVACASGRPSPPPPSSLLAP